MTFWHASFGIIHAVRGISFRANFVNGFVISWIKSFVYAAYVHIYSQPDRHEWAHYQLACIVLELGSNSTFDWSLPFGPRLRLWQPVKFLLSTIATLKWVYLCQMIATTQTHKARGTLSLGSNWTLSTVGSGIANWSQAPAKNDSLGSIFLLSVSHSWSRHVSLPVTLLDTVVPSLVPWRSTRVATALKH